MLFPACAGVILLSNLINHHNVSFPHMCGGDPYPQTESEKRFLFSPHVRG